jgi:integrase
MRYLSQKQLDGLLREAGHGGIENLLLVTLIFNHGLRISEALPLTTDNFKDGFLTVHRLKGSNKTVQALLPDEKALLAAYQPYSEGRLFDICRMTAWRRVKAWGVAAGVPAHKCFPHAIKHSCAKAGLSGGMTLPELQTYLGHVSGNSTMQYLKEDDETACTAFAKALGAK